MRTADNAHNRFVACRYFLQFFFSKSVLHCFFPLIFNIIAQPNRLVNLSRLFIKIFFKLSLNIYVHACAHAHFARPHIPARAHAWSGSRRLPTRLETTQSLRGIVARMQTYANFHIRSTQYTRRVFMRKRHRLSLVEQ